VTFFADDNSVGVTLATQGLSFAVDASGNVWDPQGQSPPLRTGTKAGTWNNYAVAFDRLNQRLALYVNNQLLQTLDLTVFANGALANQLSNAAVTVGANDPQRVWLDNFQVGAPYDGYQAPVAANRQTGYDFSVRSATTSTGGIQGTVVLGNATNPDPFAPGSAPVAGLTLFVDLNGDGVLSQGDPTATTDAHGNYRFSGLIPGTYVIRQVPSGYRVRAVREPDGTIDPNAQAITVDILGGQTAYANNFSNLLLATSVAAKFSSAVSTDYVRLVPQDANTTQVQIDVMNGASVGRTQVVGTFASRDWRPVGIGDFNGDGQTDLLFQNQRDGSVQYWELKNGQLQGIHSLGTVSPDWQARTTADLGGKGISDLILQQGQDGPLALWRFDGPNVVARAPLPADICGALLAAGDLAGDGRIDLLSHSGDELYRTPPGGAAVRLGAVPQSWAFAGTVRLDGGAADDLLFEDLSDGSYHTWKLDGQGGLAGSALLTEEQVAQAFLASDEYISRAGATGGTAGP
jgi:hypothetical protein